MCVTALMRQVLKCKKKVVIKKFYLCFFVTKADRKLDVVIDNKHHLGYRSRGIMIQIGRSGTEVKPPGAMIELRFFLVDGLQISFSSNWRWG